MRSLRPIPLSLLACCLFLACGGEGPAVPDATTTSAPVVAAPVPEQDADSNNLLNMAFGAAVVSRTGGWTLENSVVHAIDGLELTGWISPPGTAEETMVFSLLAPSRVTQVGLTSSEESRMADKIHFEGSMDGRKWTDLGSVVPTKANTRIMTEVPETTVRFIRVTTSEQNDYTVAARAFHVFGAETAPPQTPSFSGCWVINGERAEIRQDGARIRGTIQSDPPILLDGGTDNRVAMLIWMEGPAWGYAALTRSNDGRHLSGLKFHEEIDTGHVGEGWFGDRCSDGSTGALPDPGGPAVASRFLERAKRYPVYGLVFDSGGSINEELSRAAIDDVATLLSASPRQRFRLVAYELRYETAEQNRMQTSARLASLSAALRARGIDPSRLELVARGNEWSGPPIQSSLQRLLASRIDVESFGG